MVSQGKLFKLRSGEIIQLNKIRIGADTWESRQMSREKLVEEAADNKQFIIVQVYCWGTEK